MTIAPKEKQKVSLKTALILIVALAALAVACVMLTGCQRLRDYGYWPDNIVEELAEETIDHYTGVEIDLTPFSPEV